jgi:hypothetical protein
MIRQLLKLFFTGAFLLTHLTSYSQFTNDNHVGVKIRGKVRSYSVQGYNKANDSDSLFTQLWMKRQNDYNKKGQLIRSSHAYDLRGSDINDKFIDTFIYDKKGNIKDILHYDSHGKPTAKETFVYSRSGRFIIIKQHLYNGDTSRSSEQLKLDAANRIIARYNYGSRTDTSVMAYNGVTYYKYNKQGLQVLNDTYNNDGHRRYFTTSTYNKDGDIIEFTEYAQSKDRKLTTGSYRYINYDLNHNWISSFYIMSNGKPNARYERQITYYK